MNIALIFAGGTGTRMNSKTTPKQFLPVFGKTIIQYTLECFENHEKIDAICIICIKEWCNFVEELVKKEGFSKVRWIVPGGKTAMESQYIGLQTVSSSCADDSIVLLHDGVRPLLGPDLISSCIQSTQEYGSAITVAPAIETIIETNDKQEVTRTIDRNLCSLARAPQCFYLHDILSAHNNALASGNYTFIDSASLMLSQGKVLHTVQGPADNIKITTPIDYYIFRAILEAKESSLVFGVN
ncbi:4-diphosphocytidyl-2-methyl-D-erythritol synthase [Sphaerochaeta pleomorpha str. Grapes]|uniref:4-diphosphocytidyl-2-methyl-D-erythritol synthase n=1 Tax=Sphaerochaeta pleomorpha (strain ATCC BAA-1885 / DSM 22778 / Grapes) TaxID=158190 RepID=G8QVT4_SPHPG|nr:IspD/TarI family cytidylyltransferase [Sphaerochaeta pleomorpha]AEV29376.1 4-diphosphocytidyl-2-methyl-D-erythritol synthase [Sphaerochaeta pleomorpha str. Grapes]